MRDPDVYLKELNHLVTDTRRLIIIKCSAIRIKHGVPNRMDFDTLTMELRMKIPSLIITADYEMKGKVLALSMDGKGDCTLKFSK